jgi:hypothetical protein
LIVAVGGDYRPEATSKLTAAWSIDRGKTWQPAVQPPTKFVSAACSFQGSNLQQESSANNGNQLPVFVATGPAASYLSTDGKQWSEFSKIGFHAIEATATRTVFAVGSEGRFGKLQLGGTP